DQRRMSAAQAKTKERTTSERPNSSALPSMLTSPLLPAERYAAWRSPPVVIVDTKAQLQARSETRVPGFLTYSPQFARCNQSLPSNPSAITQLKGNLTNGVSGVPKQT